jgi:hypothetical protein
MGRSSGELTCSLAVVQKQNIDYLPLFSTFAFSLLFIVLAVGL